jgi:hypothetical protein
MIARYFDLLQQRPAVSGYRDVTDFTGVISQNAVWVPRVAQVRNDKASM